MSLFDYLEDRRREAQVKRQLKDAGKIVAGASLGAMLGILFAPQSGEKTRKDIGDKAQETKEYLESASRDVADDIQFKAFQASEQVKKTYENLKDMADQKKGEFKDDVEVAKAKAKAIGEVVRDEAKDLKEDVENTKDSLKDGAENIKDEVKEGASKVSKEAKEATEEIKKEVEKTKENIDKK